ncbi:hypothetical protein SME36J_46430 [Serratia marcescens]|nr:hypothetical protein SME36J_46430 [Serratia marcescens]
MVLLSPGEDLVCIYTMEPCDMRNDHTWLKRFLDNGNFFLWRTALAAFWSEQFFDHAYLPTSH